MWREQAQKAGVEVLVQSSGRKWEIDTASQHGAQVLAACNMKKEKTTQSRPVRSTIPDCRGSQDEWRESSKDMRLCGHRHRGSIVNVPRSSLGGMLGLKSTNRISD